MTTFGSIPSNDELITGTNVTLGGLNLASLYPDPGVDKPASLKVTQRGAGANMSVDVAAGSAYVPDGSSGINLISKASVTNLTVSNGDAGGIRHDFVTIDSSGTLAVLEGTVGSDPTPAANTYVLARIRVPASESTSIDDADIDDKREYGTVFRRPRGEVDYIIDSSADSIGGTLEQVGNLATTLAIPEDRRYKFTARERFDRSSGSGVFTMVLTEDGTIVANLGREYQDASHIGSVFEGSTTITGGGISKSYVVQAQTAGTLVTDTVVLATVDPHLRIEDAGGLNKPSGSEGQ